VILATVTEADAMSAALGGLGHSGELVIVGIPAKPIQAAVPGMVMQRQSIHGWPSGTSIDSEDTLKFSEIAGVLPLIETYPLERAAEAYDRMMMAGSLSRGARNWSLKRRPKAKPIRLPSAPSLPAAGAS
jgi:D-arabinose 1-dehydrogenase-like Zn-dependent alcohol dehydrogenase